MKEEHKQLIEFVISEFKKDKTGRLIKADFTRLIKDLAILAVCTPIGLGSII